MKNNKMLIVALLLTSMHTTWLKSETSDWFIKYTLLKMKVADTVSGVLQCMHYYSPWYKDRDGNSSHGVPQAPIQEDSTMRFYRSPQEHTRRQAEIREHNRMLTYRQPLTNTYAWLLGMFNTQNKRK